jgi:misacylated tRNA(Ala) deacylase
VSDTSQLYLHDAYLRSFTARVVEVRDGNQVALDQTAFYPTGGGQPFDTGTLGSARVVGVRKEGGTVWHTLEGPVPEVGEDVAGEVDWERRHALMRTHTALHVLSGIVWRDYGAKVTGGNMEPGEARMDFELESLSPEFGREVELKLNEALASARPVTVRFLPRAEALADPDLIRTKVNLIPESVDPIRIIDIEGIDRQADGGTHVRSTEEVGRVRVVKTDNKGKNFKRMRIAVEGSG